MGNWPLSDSAKLEQQPRSVLSTIPTSRDYQRVVEIFPPETSPMEMEYEFSLHGDSWTYAADPNDEDCECCDSYYHVNFETVVVAIDGDCGRNGTTGAYPAVGVYFGVNNEHNICGRLYYDKTPTKSRTELAAAINALESIQRIYDSDPSLVDLKSIVIKTNSAQLVNSMTRYIFKWRSNNFINTKGFPVKDQELFERLDDLIVALNTAANIEVDFWHVDRQYNLHAGRLTRTALSAGGAHVRLKTYVVVLTQGLKPWHEKMYLPLMDMLHDFSDVEFVNPDVFLADLVEGPNTRFLIVDDLPAWPENFVAMKEFLGAVREKGSHVVFGALFADALPQQYLDDFLCDLLKVPWRCGDYGRARVLQSDPELNIATHELPVQGTVKARFLKNVPIAHQVYGRRNHHDSAFAACAPMGRGSVGYVGFDEASTIELATILVMLDLPLPADQRQGLLSTKVLRGQTEQDPDDDGISIIAD